MQITLIPGSFSVSCRNRDGAGLFPGHVLVSRDQSGEVREPYQRKEVLAVQPATAVADLPARSAPGLVQLRPVTHVAVRQSAGGS